MIGVTFILFHAVGMIAFCFGLLMLIIYMAKFAKKELLWKVAVYGIALGLLLSVVGLSVVGSYMTEDGWNMMEKYSERGYMMNWDNDETTTSSATSL